MSPSGHAPAPTGIPAARTGIAGVGPASPGSDRHHPRRTGIAGLAVLALAACFETPDYTYRSCSLTEPCPRGFVCGLDELCHPRDALPPPEDAGTPPPACDPDDPSLEVPPPTGWLVTYHPIAEDGTIIRTECLERHTLETDTLDFTPITSTAATNTRALAAVGRARRTFDGITLLTLSHGAGLRIRAGGTTLYDTFRFGPAENVQAREYLHGAQSLVFELALSGPRPHAKLSWQNECDLVAAPTQTTWQARYYRAGDGPEFALDRRDCLGAEIINTVTLTARFNAGAPAIVRNLGITDRFGAEYLAPRTFLAATQVSAYYDDGIRIFVDDSLIFESWLGSQSARTQFTAAAGDHQFRLEWFENQGLAGIELTW